MADPTKKLLKLLDKEKQALLAGKYEVLDDLTVEKTALFDAYQENEPTLDDALNVHTAMMHNQRLIGSTIRGLKEARRRLGDAQMAQGTLSTYSQSGARTEIKSTPPKMLRKA